MTDEQLIEFKNLSMQDGKLNLSWFADYVAQAEREACAKLVADWDKINWNIWDCAAAIRARGQA
jgi:hypothetical protein